MTGKKAKFILSVVTGLLVAFAAGDLRAALRVAEPGWLVAAQGVDGNGVIKFAGEGASWCVSEALKSYESPGWRGLHVSADGTNCLAPLFPLSSGPADHRIADPEIEVCSVPFPGAAAIPGSVNGGGSIVSGFAVANKLMVMPQAAIQTGLQPEARMVLPTDPPYRFFRPPRKDMLSIAE